VTYRAWTFVFNAPTGRLLGFGLVCLEARYASIATADGARQLHRRHATPAQWTRIGQEIADTLPPFPLKRSSAILEVLAGYGIQPNVSYLHAIDLDVPDPAAAAAALDAHLLGQLPPPTE